MKRYKIFLNIIYFLWTHNIIMWNVAGIELRVFRATGLETNI